MPNIKKLIEESGVAFNSEERINAENYWRDICEYVMPQQIRFLQNKTN